MVFLKHKDLAKLVEQAQQGDAQAFQKIYEHTASFQYFQLRQLMADSSEAQDALQETYFLLYQNLDKIKPPAALIAYLNRLSYYVGKNLSRRADTFHRRNVDIEEASYLPDPAANLHGRVEDHELSEQIRAALEELPNQERLILTMRYYQNQTLQQIAYSMNISLSTVKRLQRTAKRRLKCKLERQGIVQWAAVVPHIVTMVNSSVERQALPSFSNSTGYSSKIKAPDSLLNSRPPVHLLSGTAGMAAVKSVILMACVTGAASTVSAVTPPPSIEQIQIPQAYTESPAKIEVTVNSSIPIRSVKFQNTAGQSASFSPNTGKSENLYTAEIKENGSYTLTAVTIAGKKTKKNFQVNCIDTVYPEIKSVAHCGQDTIVTFQDAQTGIDFKSLYCESESGTLTFPTSVDTKSNQAVFCLPKENNKISFSDKAGNTCRIRLKYRDII